MMLELAGERTDPIRRKLNDNAFASASEVFSWGLWKFEKFFHVFVKAILFASNDSEFLYHFNGIFCRPTDRPSKIKILFKTNAKAGDIFLPTHAVVIQHFFMKAPK